MHFDFRHFVHAQHPVVVEVRLLHAAVLEGDLPVQGCGEPVHDRALDLALDDVGFTVMPQSTAATTRCTFGVPSGATETSATSAHQLPKENTTAMPR